MGRIRAIIFDLDGTLVRYRNVEFESSWGAIATAAGKQEESEQILREFLPRRDAYEEWVERDAALLAGIPVEEITARIFPPPYATGAREAIAALRGRYTLGILSSGVDLVADRTCQELGLDFSIANRLLIEDGYFTGESETIVDLWTKADVMKEIARQHGLDLSEICFVGDHMNDVPVMHIVGLSIAMNPKDEELERIADYVVPDFTTIPQIMKENM
ncbi:MAG: HAD family phosphatase [Candidatus Bipolaricaulota bacterium]|nr:HAD family phosphatase [Candidatus Bipolaricaulota bacterium]